MAEMQNLRHENYLLNHDGGICNLQAHHPLPFPHEELSISPISVKAVISYPFPCKSES